LCKHVWAAMPAACFPQGLEADLAAHLPGPGQEEEGTLRGAAARLASKVAKAEARLASLAPAPDSALNFRPAVRAVWVPTAVVGHSRRGTA
jgi:hypothetical protein